MREARGWTKQDLAERIGYKSNVRRGRARDHALGERSDEAPHASQYHAALKLLAGVDPPTFFTIDERLRHVEALLEELLATSRSRLQAD